ncbi:PilZ domain-containing protein [Thermodesulfobacterium sp. TA1]|uniref:PilZ domain-containing protein n=1 Tax=Thermodesulfobacterium sp. TA1 TaxID=2234087 RepID=UPI001232B1DF|nr:PilZ domain-containing protein [Thermodesulfobacterium sp. TA1]QER42348.1 PilZ domain-containing protein [Thermodesulfobacterium sp. TA1]
MEREAVRIDVVVPLKVTKIEPSEIENKVAHVVGDTTIFSYIPIKDTIDEALNSWLRLINAKLDYLINLMSREKEGFNELPYQKVNLSEKGIRFLTKEPFEIGDFVEIKTVLDIYQPVGFYLYGKVVRCNPKEEKYEVAVEFINMPKDIKDKLSFFILQKEREIIREMKEL